MDTFSYIAPLPAPKIFAMHFHPDPKAGASTDFEIFSKLQVAFPGLVDPVMAMGCVLAGFIRHLPLQV